MTYYQCLGCFKIYIKVYKNRPDFVCCEKHPGEPYAMEKLSRADAMVQLNLIKEYERGK